MLRIEAEDPNRRLVGFEHRLKGKDRLTENGQLFEVQFHTEASFEAKQETHAVYERLRDPATPPPRPAPRPRRIGGRAD